ncbi:hypothetical protein MKX01_041154 [Papaver californicum]|nr:hypothetical protein MKX01_041154 [Papaver californicum]
MQTEIVLLSLSSSMSPSSRISLICMTHRCKSKLGIEVDEVMVASGAGGDMWVSRLINHLKEYGVPIAVATGSHKRHFELKTQKHGEIFSKMHHIVTGDDPEVKQGKPAPDVFLAAARRFEESPVDLTKILVFEDAPSGVAAAKNAGMYVVMVPDLRLDESYQAAADQVLSSLLDFNPSDWSLPSFMDATN